MHEPRFFIWAGDPAAGPSAGTWARAWTWGRAGYARPCPARAVGYVGGCACGPVIDRLRAVTSGAGSGCGARPDPVGARPRIAARKRHALYCWAGRLRDHAACVTGQRQPSARCAVGDGRRRLLCGAVGGGRRNPWRTRSAGFYGDQAVGPARRNLGGAALSDPQRRSGRAECGAGPLAHSGAALGRPSPRQSRTRLGALGCGFVPRTRESSGARTGALGGQL